MVFSIGSKKTLSIGLGSTSTGLISPLVNPNLVAMDVLQKGTNVTSAAIYFTLVGNTRRSTLQRLHVCKR